MKKLIVMLLSLCLLMGCAAEPTSDSGSAKAETSPPPSSTAEVPSAGVTYTVETETMEDSVKTDDGTVLYTYNYELPRLMVQTSDSAAAATENAVTKAFNDGFDSWRSGEAHTETLETAREEYAWWVQEGMLDEYPWTEYSEGFTYTVYQSERLVSVAAQLYFYSGGAHPNTAYSAWNFDLEEGRFVSIDALGKDETFRQAVTTEILRQIVSRAAEADVPAGDMLWSDYEEIVALWTNYAVSFDASGMTVTFSPYDLASYAAGPQAFVIPYELIQPYLSEYGQELLQISSANIN